MKTFLLILILSTMVYPGKRQVLIFYSTAGNVAKDKQLALLNKAEQGVRERDIEIHIYKTDEAKTEMKQWKISPQTAFTFMLIGKDGGEKMRTDTVVSTTQLFAVIDAMPMRKREMKNE